MAKFIDRTGFRYGMLTVIEHSYSETGTYWRCICDCGNESIVTGGNLAAGHTKSCGCGSIKQAIENCRTANEKNKLPYSNIKQLRSMYRGMIHRCYNQNNKDYRNYGGRGIRICKKWLDDKRAFYEFVHANKHDPGHQIDRIDNDGNYEPKNCRFVSAFVQTNNRTSNCFIDWEGKRLTIRQWERELGMPINVLHQRLRSNWSIERAMTQPVRAIKR